MNTSDFQSEIVAGVHVLDSHKRSLENPNLPLNSPQAWEEAGFSFSSDTGESITPAKAFELPPFWHAVQMISGDIAGLPLNLYRRRPDIADGARERDYEHPLDRILCKVANEETESLKFWCRYMAQALVWGNAYAYIERDGQGNVLGLYNLLPDRTQAERIKGKLWYVTEAGDGGQLKALFPEEVLHIEGLSVGLLGGMPVFQKARQAIAVGLAQLKFSAKFFKHGGRVGGILELPAGLNKTARDNVEEGFRKSYEGAENPFKTVILRDNAKFHEAQQSPHDSQLVEASDHTIKQIAHIFNLPASKLNVKDSVSYNSTSADNQNYFQTTLKIWLLRICAACNFRLLSEEEQRTHFVEHNTSDLLRLDPFTQSQMFQILISSRVVNPNECRAKLNMLPYDGGEEFVNPNTMKSGSPDEPTDDEPEDEPADPPEEDTPPTKPTRTTEYLRTLFEITSRARAKSKESAKFLSWLDGNLAPHRADYKGGEAFPFDSIVADLARNVQVWRAEELPQRVDEWCKVLETEHNYGN